MFLQIPGMILQVRGLPIHSSDLTARSAFFLRDTVHRCGFLVDQHQPHGTWWRFPVIFLDPETSDRSRVPKKIWVKFCSPQPPAPESLEFSHPVFEASPFCERIAKGRVESNHSLTRHPHCHMTLTRRLSRLSEQALGYGIFALLLCPRSRKKSIGHGHLGTAVMVSHLVNIGSQLRS